MDALVAEIAVAVVPEPVPVVMESILSELALRRGPEPKVVIDTRRNRRDRRVTDGIAPLVAQPASHVDIAEQAVAHALHRFLQGFRRAALAAHLNDLVVFARGRDNLLSFKHIVRAWLLDVDVLAGLERPNRLERVRMVRR